MVRDSQQIPDPRVVKKIRTESKLRRNLDDPVVPVALQFLYNGATAVQGPEVKTSADPGFSPIPVGRIDPLNFNP